MDSNIIKKLFYTLVLLTALFLPLSIMKISTNTTQSIPIIITVKDDSIGTLIIDKINLTETLYDIKSSKNNIEEHVSILKESTFPNKQNSTLILAAHSGPTSISFFNDLNQLEIEDEIKVIYQNKTYIYLVKEIWREKKNGYIHINKENKRQLVLTTCDPIKKEYQIIVNCTEKESN